MLQVTVPITVANNQSSVVHTITSAPSSNDSGVLVVYDVDTGGAFHAGDITVTLPDAGQFLNEGVKTLQITIGNQQSGHVEFVIESTDSDSNTVLNNSGATSPLPRGVIVTCTPFVYDGNHYWTVSG